MSLRKLLAASVLLFLAGAARADMGVPGFRRAELHVRFENLEDYPEHVFFIVPTPWLMAEERSGWAGSAQPFRLSPGEPLRLGDHGLSYRRLPTWLVVAVPRKRTDAAGATWDWAQLDAKRPGVLHSNTFPLQEGDVVFFNPKAGEVHRFRIDIDRGQLTVAPLGVETFTSSEGWEGLACVMVALFLSAALAWIGVQWARYRWKEWATRRPTS
jgi:hypothetical protein